MTQTTQEKFLEKMEVVAATYKYDLIVNRDYANTGHIRFEDPGSFTPRLDLGFGFENDRVKFYNLPRARPDGGAEPFPQWAGYSINQLDGVVEAITAWVKR